MALAIEQKKRENTVKVAGYGPFHPFFNMDHGTTYAVFDRESLSNDPKSFKMALVKLTFDVTVLIKSLKSQNVPKSLIDPVIMCNTLF